MYLENINSSADLTGLSYKELETLCEEIREFLIDNVSQTGGHLASNLGAVELTVALNRVYNCDKDRVLYDVGHQCYVHKIINGRRGSFNTLRQLNGLSGFPKPYESETDAFIAGHASDSVSLALGMARARTVLDDKYDVCAVIGDGALTGGLAYEGLENVAASNEPVVVILNDNAMSINGNVGGMSKALSKLRLSQGYYDFKKKYRSAIGIDTGLYRFAHRLKSDVKERVLAGNMFVSLGLNYLGPVDGHNLRELEEAIKRAKEMHSPVLLHVITSKGKGCAYAEEHPDIYHGIGPFDRKTGKPKSVSVGFGDKMGQKLCELAEKDNRIVAITAAMSDGTGLCTFAKKYPKRFFDVGIAEGHAVSMAAGMAKQGLIPVFAVYSSFLQRAYDMLMHDVALLGLHVVLCVDRAGLVGNDGETHNGVFDVSYLSSVPGMTILCPASFAELDAMLEKAIYEIEGPVAVRYPRGGEGCYKEINTEDETVLRKGNDVTAVCYGGMTSETVRAAELLAEKGISTEVIKLGKVSPLVVGKTLESLRKTGRLVICEDLCTEGSVGQKILAACEKHGIVLKDLKTIDLGNGIVAHGSVPELLKMRQMDAAGIFAAVSEMF